MSDNILATDRSEFFAILHVPSGHLMRQHRYSKGYTQQEFPLSLDDQKRSPRLFTRESSAKQAIGWWLKGKTTMRVIVSDWDGDTDEKWDTSPRGDRKPGDMVVVKMRLFVTEVIE